MKPAPPAPFWLLKRGNESDLTLQLKAAAWQWLYDRAGCRAIAFEVRLEGPAGRVSDVVGLGPRNAVYIVEVKASKSDASRDDNTPADARRLASRTHPAEDAVALTGGILEAAAALARDSLGSNWETDAAYRQAQAEHAAAAGKRAALTRRLSTFSTKFHDPAYLRAADFHYIMAPSGLVKQSSLPPYWGLLDEVPDEVVAAPPKLVRKVTAHVLRAIARANTRDMMVARDRMIGPGLGAPDIDVRPGPS